MNRSEVALPPNSFEQRLIRVERGVRLFGITILLLSSAPNLALALSIHSYADAMPTLVRIPSLSPFIPWVFAHPIYLITLAVLWPLTGCVITLRAADPFRAMVASCVYLILVTIQFTFTWFAFIAPIRELYGTLTKSSL